MGLYNDLSPAPSYSGRAETMGGNGTETNIYSIAPSVVNGSHCSLTNKTNTAAVLYVVEKGLRLYFVWKCKIVICWKCHLKCHHAVLVPYTLNSFELHFC